MSGKLSREEYRKAKDLDAARKAGTAAPELDEKGNIINPHVPEFMAKKPFYMDDGKRSLSHQKKPVRSDDIKAGIDDWYKRGATAGPAATKFRKGACENCGAMTHKRRDCLERPRKKGANLTGRDIRPDEVIQDIKGLTYDAKRDRWNGYDPTEHRKLLAEFEAIEEERRRLREEQIDNQTSTDLTAAKKLAKKEKAPKKDDDDFGSSDEDSDDADKYADKADQVGQKIDADKRITVRNLRIREDRAKYLYNLDPDSAYYDPKTRSMRDAPHAGVPPEQAEYAGDNFARASGDNVDMQRLQMFAWQAEARGNDVHMQANPTVNEMQFKEFQRNKETLREKTKGSILERYGGEQHFDALPRELLTGQTEAYVEYDQTGKVVKGQERAKARSKYEEDVLDNNHTAVWGSWYDMDTASWGYACCHSVMPNSYCTGKAGIEASKASTSVAPRPRSPSDSDSSDEGRRNRKSRRRDSSADRDRLRSYTSRKGLGEGDVASRLDKAKLNKALVQERAKRDPNRSAAQAESSEVTEEQLEAYRMATRDAYEDPMANYKDEVEDEGN